MGGEVSIDTSPIPGDPQATLKKMRQVRAAALAPADPSPQDLKVASQASASATKALSELMLLQAEKRTGTNDSTAFGNLRDAARTYEQISGIPDETPSTFRIAV